MKNINCDGRLLKNGADITFICPDCKKDLSRAFRLFGREALEFHKDVHLKHNLRLEIKRLAKENKKLRAAQLR